MGGVTRETMPRFDDVEWAANAVVHVWDELRRARYKAERRMRGVAKNTA